MKVYRVRIVKAGQVVRESCVVEIGDDESISVDRDGCKCPSRRMGDLIRGIAPRVTRSEALMVTAQKRAVVFSESRWRAKQKLLAKRAEKVQRRG